MIRLIGPDLVGMTDLERDGLLLGGSALQHVVAAAAAALLQPRARRPVDHVRVRVLLARHRTVPRRAPVITRQHG